MSKIGKNYYFRIAKRVLRECTSWSQEQFLPFLIALASAWAALHYGLVPIDQTRAAYLVYVSPFALALILYLFYQVARVPYLLDREQQKILDEKSDYAGRLLKFFDLMKEPTFTEKPKIKIVVAPFSKANDFAVLLDQILRLLDYPIIHNSDTGLRMFRANTINNRITVRCRPNPGFSHPAVIGCSFALRVGIELLSNVYATQAEFPDTDDYNYIQVEIFGSP
jgi:hypothetical protein